MHKIKPLHFAHFHSRYRISSFPKCDYEMDSSFFFIVIFDFHHLDPLNKLRLQVLRYVKVTHYFRWKNISVGLSIFRYMTLAFLIFSDTRTFNYWIWSKWIRHSSIRIDWNCSLKSFTHFNHLRNWFWVHFINWLSCFVPKKYNDTLLQRRYAWPLEGFMRFQNSLKRRYKMHFLAHFIHTNTSNNIDCMSSHIKMSFRFINIVIFHVLWHYANWNVSQYRHHLWKEFRFSFKYFNFTENIIIWNEKIVNHVVVHWLCSW